MLVATQETKMTIQQILRGMHGVWHGTYTIMKPDGTLIERYAASRKAAWKARTGPRR